MTDNQRKMKNFMIKFSVRDKKYFTSNKYIGDAYLMFKDIKDFSQINGIEVQQMQLKLTKLLKSGEFD